jgi:hypothetical protein
MKRIVRLTENDLTNLIKRIISESSGAFPQNTVLKFETVTGYKSALFPDLSYTDNGSNWTFDFGGSKQLGSSIGMKDGSFQTYGTEYDATSLNQRSAAMATVSKKAKTRAEVESALSNTMISTLKKAVTVKAGGTYKNKEGKTVTWGRPGFTAANEMTDAICKVMNITA